MSNELKGIRVRYDINIHRRGTDAVHYLHYKQLMDDIGILLDHITELEAMRDVAREMREYIDHRAVMVDMGVAEAEEKIAAWDAALADVSDAEQKNTPPA